MPETDGQTAPSSTSSVGPAVAYDLVFECRSRRNGALLAARLEEAVAGFGDARRAEEGPTWSVTVTFPSQAQADAFFADDRYEGFTADARERCRSSVLVVPLGPTDV